MKVRQGPPKTRGGLVTAMTGDVITAALWNNEHVHVHTDVQVVKCAYCGRRGEAVGNCAGCGAAMPDPTTRIEVTTHGDKQRRFIERK